MSAVRMILDITLYRLKIILHSKILFVLMIIIPLILTFIAGSALKIDKFNEVRMAVVDADESEFSNMLIEGLKQRDIRLYQYDSVESAYEMLENGMVEAAFLIDEGFEEEIMQGKTEGLISLAYSPSSFITGYSGEIIAGEVLRLAMQNSAVIKVKEEFSQRGINLDEHLNEQIIDYYNSQWEPAPLMTIEYSELGQGVTKETDNESFSVLGNISMGFLLIFLMFYILFSSGWLVEEKANGTIDRIISVPAGLKYTFVANILALFICALSQVIVFTVGIWLISGTFLLNNVLIVILLFLYISCVISISMILAALFTTANQLQTVAPATAFISSFIGGCFWSYAQVPEKMKYLSLLTPQGWVIQGLNSISVYNTVSGELFAVFIVLFIVPLILFPTSYKIISEKIT